MRTLVVLLTASAASGTVIESQIVSDAQSQIAVKADDFSCDKDLTDFVVRGKDWTNVLQTVCKVWTTVPQFGEFPGKNVTKLKGILEVAFKEGGLLDQLKTKLGTANNDYCLRREVTRTELTYTASESTCPEIVDEEFLEENPWLIEEETEGDRPNPREFELLEGQWTCAKNDAGDCSCSQRYLKKKPLAAMVSIASRPSGCQMVHDKKCYGDCPSGYRPTWLKGWFRPVCTSVCSSTNHVVTCGVGCAASRSKCVERILKQLKAVALSASKVAAFVIAGPAGLSVAQTVENVVKIAEFAFNTLKGVLEVVDVAYKMYKREEANLATVVAIFQVIKDFAVATIGSWQTMQPLVQASTKLFMTLVDANFQWKNINIGWVANAIMEHGASALKGAFLLAREFAFKKCDLADATVYFTVENVGDDRLIGPWQRLGVNDGKAKYCKLGDAATTLLEWDARRASWSFWVLDRTFGRGWWWGWAGAGWRELYETKSNTPGFPTSGWKRLEGALPLPANVDAKNGGK